MPAKPTMRRRRLAAELRRLRKERDLSADQVVERLGSSWSASKLSRLENRQSNVSTRELSKLLDVYQVDDQEYRRQLVDWARRAGERGWWQSYGSLVPPEYANLIALEDEATTIRIFAPQVVPGLLQTEDYSAAVVRAYRPTATEDSIRRRVSVKTARQEILTRREPLPPPHLLVILSEAVLRQTVGGRHTMRDQLQSLEQVRSGTNIEVQILPFSAGAHPAMTAPFTLLGFPDSDEPGIVHVEHNTGAVILEEQSDLEFYDEIWQRISAMALSPIDSRAMLHLYPLR